MQMLTVNPVLASTLSTWGIYADGSDYSVAAVVE